MVERGKHAFPGCMLGRLLDIGEGGTEYRLVTDRKPYTTDRTKVSSQKKKRKEKKKHTPAEHKWDKLFKYQPSHQPPSKQEEECTARTVGYLFFDTMHSKCE